MMEKNQIFENIMSRTSVRSYTEKPVEQEKVEIMLRAGMAAPSACNKQPWHFVVINDREILDQIPQFSPYASMVKQAPLAIVVCGCLDKTLEGTEQEFWIQDERYEGMQQLLHLPKTMIPLNTLIIGYPKNQAEAKDKWKEENVSYNKWMEKNS